jgi:hypothetical protein
MSYKPIHSHQNIYTNIFFNEISLTLLWSLCDFYTRLVYDGSNKRSTWLNEIFLMWSLKSTWWYELDCTYLVMWTISVGISLILLVAMLSSVRVFIWQRATGKLARLLSARFKLHRLWNLKIKTYIPYITSEGAWHCNNTFSLINALIIMLALSLSFSFSGALYRECNIIKTNFSLCQIFILCLFPTL